MTSSTTIAIRTYLDMIGQPKKRGRKPAGEEVLRAKLEDVQAALVDARNVEFVHLFQEKLNLEERLRELKAPGLGLDEAEKAFIEHAAEWAKAKKVSYSALRAVGVSAAVLRSAGMSP